MPQYQQSNIQNQPNIRFLPDADLTHQVNVFVSMAKRLIAYSILTGA